MKVKVSGFKDGRKPEESKVLEKFIRFLQDQAPLNKQVSILFKKDRKSTKMTTGARYPGHKIYVLDNNRMLIDVLRTLAHEWIHEFQHQKLNIEKKKKFKDIGGPEENMANVLAGIFLKKFDKSNPEFEKLLYNETDN